MYTFSRLFSWKRKSSLGQSSSQGSGSSKGKTAEKSDGKEMPAQEKDAQAADGAASKEQIDVLFLQDTTASQGPYINSAKSAIRSICSKISTASNMSPDDIRFGLIAFRDHPPQDRTYVTKNFGFSSEINAMEANLLGLKAMGGGDGPEAQTAALAEGLGMEWREKAAKMVVLITDAPPHGIGEANDGFDASPDQNDPLDVARRMAEQGITLYVVACEPTLSQYRHAVDFYKALTQITSGKMFPLTMADKLGDYIAGTAIETIETERLINEYSKDVVDNVYEQSKPIQQVVEEVHAQMKARGKQMKSLAVENVYTPSSKADSNVSIWKKSQSVLIARGEVEEIEEPRMMEEYGSSGYRPRGRALAVPRGPTVELKEVEVDYARAERVVMQSVARKSEVTARGMTKRK